MPDCLDTLARLSPRKRRRLSSLFFGNLGIEASQRFLADLSAELGPLGVPADNLGTFFAADIELDAVYAAFRAGSRFDDPDAPPIDDRRAVMEMDGACLDAVLAARSRDGSFDLILFHAKLSGDGRAGASGAWPAACATCSERTAPLWPGSDLDSSRSGRKGRGRA